MDSMVDEQPKPKGSFWVGFAIAGGVNLGALLISVVTIAIGIGIVLVMGFGLLQIFWLAPFYLKFHRKGEDNACKGVLLAGGITVLLSATCWSNLNLGNMH